jgi:hypothetical protein
MQDYRLGVSLGTKTRELICQRMSSPLSHGHSPPPVLNWWLGASWRSYDERRNTPLPFIHGLGQNSGIVSNAIWLIGSSWHDLNNCRRIHASTGLIDFGDVAAITAVC